MNCNHQYEKSADPLNVPSRVCVGLLCGLVMSVFMYVGRLDRNTFYI